LNKTRKVHQEQPLKLPQKKSLLSPGWQLILFVVVTGLIFYVLFNTIYKTPYSPIGKIFLNDASLVMQGQVPYLDFNFEYPPLALLFFVLPRLATSSLHMYTLLYKTEVLLAVLIGLLLIYLIAKRLGKSPWQMMLVYTLCILAVGPIIAEQFDIFPAVITLGSIFALMNGKNKIAWALLALGILIKIYPIFLAPVYLAIALRNHHYRAAATEILTALIIGIIVAIPFVILGSDSIKNLAEYHLQRGIQLESTYSSFLLIGDMLGLGVVKTIFDFGSWNLTGGLSGTLMQLSGYLLMVLLLITYWFIYRRIKTGKSQSTRIGAYALLVLCIVLISGKVLSPQYLIWLIPLIPLVLHHGKLIILAFFILISIVTYYLFPQAYLDLIDLKTIPIIFLFIRNLLLIALAIVITVYIRRMKASD
jgi:uncharacterized membrane protein